MPDTVRRGTGRTELVTAAIGEIAELGVGGMRLREVAIRAGLSVGSVSYHFAERHELVDAAVDAFAERLTSRAAGATTGEAAAAALRDFYSDREATLFWAETRIHATRDDHAGDVADLIHATLAELVARVNTTASGREIVAALNTASVDTARTHREVVPYSRAMRSVVTERMTPER